MTKRIKCQECGKQAGSNPEQCECCWLTAMGVDERLRDLEEQRRCDAARDEARER